MKTLQEKFVKDSGKINNSAEIILHNDSVNTLPYVVACLVRYCGHSATQAEQCAILTHYKGQCSIKVGDYIDLLPIYIALKEKNLIVDLKN